MRYQFSLATVALFFFGAVACRTIPPQAALHTPCDSNLARTEHCSADGVVVVQAVDDRRILIAIDTQIAQKPDGFVDDLFLYTASEPTGLRISSAPFSGHLEYSQGILRVVGKDGRQPIVFLVMPAGGKSVVALDKSDERRFDHSIGLAHYSGWNGLRVARLKELRQSPQCESAPGACVEVDGIHISFPA